MLGMNAVLNKKGFTLVEVMVALLILLFISLAFMQTALVSVDSNIKNVIRDEAARIAEVWMNDARSLGYNGLITVGTPYTATVNRNFRDIINFPYTATRRVTQFGTTSNIEVDINVQWTWQGQPYTHTVSTFMRQQ